MKLIITIFIFGLGLHITKIQAQTYEFSYNIVIGLTQKDAPALDTIPFNFIPIAKVTYKGISSSRYVKTTGIQDDEQPTSVSLEKKGENEVISDISQGFVYFISDKELHKIKKYTLKKKFGETYYIKELGIDYEVVLSKDIPAYVTPNVFFYKNKFGIKTIKTPNLYISLDYHKRVETKIDFSTFFAKSKIRNVTSFFDFFQK